MQVAQSCLIFFVNNIGVFTLRFQVTVHNILGYYLTLDSVIFYCILLPASSLSLWHACLQISRKVLKYWLAYLKIVYVSYLLFKI